MISTLSLHDALPICMATQGLRPVAEFQFMGFIYAGMEQIVSHAARMRNRTRGRLHCPLVFRAPFGGGIHAPEHHSESTRSEEHTSELQSRPHLVCRLLLEKKKKKKTTTTNHHT